jgi:hypothetical protein
LPRAIPPLTLISVNKESVFTLKDPFFLPERRVMEVLVAIIYAILITKPKPKEKIVVVQNPLNKR